MSRNRLSHIARELRERGIDAILSRFTWPYLRRFTLPMRFKGLDTLKPLVRGKVGLEIGGPSGIFGTEGTLPIYDLAERIDNVNFADSTVWTGALGEMYHFHASRPPGSQFVSEGAALPMVEDASYDFLLASHMIEHTANPLQALSEWRRILRPGGGLVVIAPHGAVTFDHRRPITAFDHLLDDERNGTGENDLTHLAEILANHDLRFDPGGGSPEAFAERSRRNLENRCLHHHVFDLDLLGRCLDHAGFDMLAAQVVFPIDMITVAVKR